jgi:hypothetical protein
MNRRTVTIPEALAPDMEQVLGMVPLLLEELLKLTMRQRPPHGTSAGCCAVQSQTNPGANPRVHVAAPPDVCAGVHPELDPGAAHLVRVVVACLLPIVG